MKKCEHCGREIKNVAEICRWCQRPVRVRAEGEPPAAPVGMYCPNCGYRGLPAQIQKGSWAIAFVLLLCFIIPGVIYVIWMQSAMYPACPQCRNPNMVPADSPRALEAR